MFTDSPVRKDDFSVSGNWRITFTVKDGTIDGLNLEDYH